MPAAGRTSIASSACIAGFLCLAGGILGVVFSPLVRGAQRVELVFGLADSTGGTRGVDHPALAPTRRLCTRAWDTCSVVSTSGVLLLAHAGELIDSADAVVRLGIGPTREYEQHVGTRTDVRYLANTFARTNRSISREMVHAVLGSEPGATILWHTNDGRYCTATMRALHKCHPRTAICPVRMAVRDRARSCLPDATNPSSGFIALYALLSTGMCRRARLFGFTDPPDIEGVRYHYFRSGRGEVDGLLRERYALLRRQRAAGARAHAITAEHRWLHSVGTAVADGTMVAPGGQRAGPSRRALGIGADLARTPPAPAAPSYIEVTAEAMRARCRDWRGAEVARKLLKYGNASVPLDGSACERAYPEC